MDDERTAIAAWKREPEGPRREAMLEAFLHEKRRLIANLTMKAARRERTGADVDDLLQAGRIGFRHALDTFDLDRGIKISTWAAWQILHEVQKVAAHATTMKLPRVRLRNVDRLRVLEALRADPNVTAESLGIPATKLDQIRCSHGVRFVSDATPAGMHAIERRWQGEAIGTPEDLLEQKERYRHLDRVLEMVRSGKTAAELGLPQDAYAAALEIIRSEDGPRGKTMMQPTGSTVNGTAGPVTAAASALKRSPKKKLSARDKLAARLAELESERSFIASLLALPDDAIERMKAVLA